MAFEISQIIEDHEKILSLLESFVKSQPTETKINSNGRGRD